MSCPSHLWVPSSDKNVCSARSRRSVFFYLIILCASRFVLSPAGKLSPQHFEEACIDHYPEQVGKQNVTFDKGFSIQDMPVSSAILSPKDKEVIIHDGYVHCEGYVLVLRQSAA